MAGLLRHRRLGQGQFRERLLSAIEARRFQTCVLMLALAIFAGPLHAGAELTIFPHKLILDQKARSGSFSLLNRGDATGLYEVYWIDNVMSPEGNLSVYEGEDYSEFSLQPFSRYSPKRVTLKPGERQIIKIGLKGKKKATEKEYLSHMSIRTLNTNLEDESVDEEAKASDATAMQFTAHRVLSLPVIWRNTDGKPATTFSDAKLVEEGLSLHVKRVGIPSSRGLVVLKLAGKKVGEMEHVAIYANLKERSIVVPLSEEERKRVAGKKVVVEFLDEDENETILASQEFTL